MKVLLVILGIVVVAAIAVVAGCRIFASRSTKATVGLTAKLPGKIAVVYYSQSKVGNTATVAKWIAKHTGGELVPIETVEAYPDAYGDTLKAAKGDMEHGGTRAIKSVPPLDGYDVVFIGSPIWYGTYAPPVAEFFKTHSFAGKTVVPFCTHGGGGAGRYFVDVRKACPAATVKEGLTIRGSNQIERRLGTGVTVHHTEDDVVNWLNAVFAATAASATTGDALGFQTDTFKTKGGKEVVVTAIKHASLYTMTPAQVAKAARTIKPKVLFPYHYSQTPIKTVVELLAGSGIDVRIRNYQ